MEYRVSVVQFKPEFLAVTENLNKLKAILSEMETDLVVLPELCLSVMYSRNRKKLIKLVRQFRRNCLSRIPTIFIRKGIQYRLWFCRKSRK
jgi:predicted amidohydrolase